MLDPLSSPVSLVSSPDASPDELKIALAHRERQIEAMSRASAALFSQRGVETLIRETLVIAMELVGASAGSIQMHDAARDVLEFRFVVGPSADRLEGFTLSADTGISGRVFHSGQSDITGEASEASDFDSSVDEKTGVVTHSLATVAIKSPSASPVGVMQISNFNDDFDAFDLEVLQIVAGQAAIAIENAKLEQSARKAAMVNLIGDVSHDIKNLLTPIQTGVWTLDPLLRQTWKQLERECAQMPPEHAERVLKATQMAREEYEWILQNALDAAERVQIRTKEIADAVKGVSATPRFVPDNFNNLCMEVIAGLRLVAYDSHIELVPDLDPSLPLVEIDHKQIYNALYNLVNNALAETPEEGTITLRSRRLGPHEELFAIEVIDTGRGMAPHVREKLFSDESVSTKPGGTGLGTRIVADIVRRHKGSISVQSEVGEGTTFTILLPMKQVR